MKDVESWIVSGDYQVPFQDDRALAVFEKFMAAYRWAGYLNLGDLMDFDSISSFNENLPGLTEGRLLFDDFKIANKILDRHQRIIRAKNKNAKFVLLEGNHEERLARWLEKHPMFKGMWSVPNQLYLAERNFKWVQSWSKGQVYKIGKASFVHGLYTNMYHAKKMLDAEAGSVFYGHTHDMMCIPRTRRDKVDLQVGQSLGCMCQMEQSYMKGKPSNWQLGFGVFHFLPDGTYSYYTPRIINNRFVGPDGAVYECD